MNALREIALLESRDVLAHRFEQLHGRTPNASKCRQIAASLIQGRQYWDSAQSAGELARPLILYYGSLAFCRALILFLDRNGGEETLSQSHGLREREWTSTLAGRGAASVLDLKLVASGGTFKQLVDATQRRERARLYVGPYPAYRQHVRPVSNFDEGPIEFSIGDLFCRVPELADLYERLIRKRSATYPVIPFGIEPHHIDLDILLTDAGPKNWDQARSDLGIPSSITIREGVSSHFGGGQPAANMRLPWNDSEWMWPQLALTMKGESWLVGPLVEGRHLNQLAVLFAVSYCLGMLVRYHPTLWIDLASQIKGDAVLPLLREARVVVEEVLPQLIMQQFDFTESIPA